MKRILAALVAVVAGGASAQQAAPPPPAFASPNLSESGARALAANCAACHGTAGRTAPGSPLTPLAGRSKDEIAQAMGQFKAGQRPATLMHQIAKGYSDAEIAAIAEYFSKQPR
jgi:cytochrome c553